MTRHRHGPTQRRPPRAAHVATLLATQTSPTFPEAHAITPILFKSYSSSWGGAKSTYHELNERSVPPTPQPQTRRVRRLHATTSLRSPNTGSDTSTSPAFHESAFTFESYFPCGVFIVQLMKNVPIVS